MEANRLALLLIMGIGLFGRAYGSTITLFDDFGSGNTYGYGSGWEIGPPEGDIAVPFTPSITSTLSTLLLGVSQTPDTGDGIVISIQTDSGANSPSGTVLESFAASNLPEWGSAASPLTLNSVLQPLLSAGVQYWIEVSPDSTDMTGGLWNTDGVCYSQQGDESYIVCGELGTVWTTDYGIETEPLPALEVTANTVPEPGAFSLLAVGLFVMGYGVNRFARS
jgi:hypothetical protein